jgi:hypothetical protein
MGYCSYTMKKLITVRADPAVIETIKAVARSEYYKSAVELMEMAKRMGIVPENIVEARPDKDVVEPGGVKAVDYEMDRLRKLAMEAAEGQAKALEEVEYWKGRFEKAAVASDDQKVVYLRGRLAACEKELAACKGME